MKPIATKWKREKWLLINVSIRKIRDKKKKKKITVKTRQCLFAGATRVRVRFPLGLLRDVQIERLVAVVRWSVLYHHSVCLSLDITDGGPPNKLTATTKRDRKVTRKLNLKKKI